MTGDEEFRKRLKYLDQRQGALIDGVSQLEKQLFDIVMKQFLVYLQKEKGRIVSNGDNIKLTQALDTLFANFRDREMVRLANQMVDDFAKVTVLNENYYTLFAGKKRFDDVRKKVRELMRLRLGINPDGTITHKGYLDNLISDESVKNDIKNQTMKAVVTGQNFIEFTEQLQFQIEGAPGVDGSLTKYVKQFAYDTYMQYDRSVNNVFSNELDLIDLIYSGGLIETSRKFCIDKNNKVFTKEEAAKWKDDPNLPKTKEERETGILFYNPEVDMGRWNCRHIARYISRELARQLRPDIK